jgi:hypothetical protein
VPALNSPVNVSYCSNDTTPASISTVNFQLMLSNGGFGTVNLSDVTVRYWLSADSNPAASITFVSYYSQNGGVDITKTITGTFAAAPAANVAVGADSYLQLSFAATGAGSLGALGGSAANIQVAFHGPGTQYSDVFNETNDYSYTPGTKCTTFAPTQTVTAYVKGSSGVASRDRARARPSALRAAGRRPEPAPTRPPARRTRAPAVDSLRPPRRRGRLTRPRRRGTPSPPRDPWATPPRGRPRASHHHIVPLMPTTLSSGGKGPHVPIGFGLWIPFGGCGSTFWP